MAESSHPCLVLAEALREKAPDREVILIDPAAGDRLRTIQNRGFRVEALDAGPERRGSGRDSLPSRRLGLDLFLAARRCLSSLRPARILIVGEPGGGGVLAAGASLGMAIGLFVPDAAPGLAPRCLGRLARQIFLAYREAEAAFPAGKALFTGYPLKTPAVSRIDIAARLGLEPSLQTLLFISRGRECRTITQAFLTHLPSLLLLEPRIQILHLVGAERYANVGEAMAHLNLPSEMADRVRTVADDSGAASFFNLTDLVLTEAGAINPAELSAGGLPMVLIARDETTAMQNAKAMVRMNAARLIEGRSLNSGAFLREIAALIKDPVRLERMRYCSEANGRSDAASSITRSFLEMGAWARNRPRRRHTGAD